ncbi:Flagellar biosynthesis protein FlhF [hydrothermal vent metagenome]|uniref:Flagellar biosynthesis protein FlhF n=1 Tax=hydrothermal vent metagenome TaxID=652676 RepID=A0A3B1AGD8_9ZZZZ
MKIKRYQANDMRSAIRIVRNELGSDAVILSNQRVGDQTEVIAAIDYDESLLNDSLITKDVLLSTSSDKNRDKLNNDLKYTRNLQNNVELNESDFILPEKVEKDLITKIEAELVEKIEKGLTKKLKQDTNIVKPNVDVPAVPAMTDMKKQIKELRSLLITQLSGISADNEKNNNPLRATVLKKLIGFGLSHNLANKISDYTNTNKDFEYNWHHALALISHKIKVTKDDILSSGGTIALIGATGVGKTTSIAKLAAQFILRHGKDSVALISTDSYRIAAHEQLRTFSRILNVPMYVATDSKQLKTVLNVVRDKKLVLIDTAGLNKYGKNICSDFNEIHGKQAISTYIVHAVNSQRSVIDDVCNSFSNVNVKACILTKLDETTNFGGALSVCIEKNIPVAYFSDGQKIPDNLHEAFSHSLVSKNVALMQEFKRNVKKYKTPKVDNGIVSHAHG